MSLKYILATSVLLAARLVAGHAAIIYAIGNAGGLGMGLGVNTSTPRDGTTVKPFQQDATIFSGASANTVGKTLGGGENNIESGTAAIMAETRDKLPQITTGGELSMIIHQVNTDGAGPYSCRINADGTAKEWLSVQVTLNVEGDANGNNNKGVKMGHQLNVAIPTITKCTGTVAGQNNVCLVRCQNPAGAGPFGGVVPVQMRVGGAGRGRGNYTACS